MERMIRPGCSCLVIKMTMKGKHIPQKMEANETYLVMTSMVIKSASTISNASG